jgi:hypothetical protein
VISRIYAFSAQHCAEVFRLSTAAGIPEGHDGWRISRFDDMFLSFSGSGKPRIHDVGVFVDCPTQGKKGVATWREGSFHTDRDEMYQRLSAIKTFST